MAGGVARRTEKAMKADDAGQIGAGSGEVENAKTTKTKTNSRDPACIDLVEAFKDFQSDLQSTLKHCPVIKKWLYQCTVLFRIRAKNTPAKVIQRKADVAEFRQFFGFAVFEVAAPGPGVRDHHAGFDLDELRESADNRDFEPVPLGITTSLGMDVEITQTESANVLGLITGSDPELKDEVVIYTAHHDHLGIGTPNEKADAIYNGARDNASGIGTVMAIAKGMKALPQAPRRSILIALVGAEEQGLLGSEYYAEHPTFAPGKIAANINYDSGNIWGQTHDVTFVGLGKSTLDRLVQMFVDKQGRVLKPGQFPDRGHFYRSDQFNFAKIGVPAVYLKSGTDFVDRPAGWGKAQINHYTDVNYHQPSDEYDDSWNFDGAVTDALLGFWTGLAVATADEMPAWNEGDEFEAARLEALAAESD